MIFFANDLFLLQTQNYFILFAFLFFPLRNNFFESNMTYEIMYQPRQIQICWYAKLVSWIYFIRNVYILSLLWNK